MSYAPRHSEAQACITPPHNRKIACIVLALVGCVFVSAPTAEATVITTGTVNPSTLATNPTTTSQIIVSFGGAPGTLEVNANPGFNTVTGNFSGSVGVVAGSGAGSNGSILV